jgi:hypothetical protein
MTSSLQEAFQKAAMLPAEQQEALAAMLLEEMAAESRWQESFSKSSDALDKLAEEALEEEKQGRTIDLDQSL